MTQEEKAKRYDEAIESLRAAFYDNNNKMCEEYRDACKRIIEPIFPELKESEDRIRKTLIEFFRDWGKTRSHCWSIFIPDILAWLEKQENKDSQVILPNILWHDGNEEPEEQCEILCEWESNDAVWHDVAFYHADTKTFWNGAEKIEDVVRWIYVNEILEKQGEQEHVIAPKFDIGDIIRNKITNEVFTITNRCISLEYYHDINHLHEVKFSEQDNWELVKHKPTWSEDDEQYLLVCKNALRKYERTDKWDANIIFHWLENKLKSVNPQNTWKPSDEQMKQLGWIAKQNKDNMIGKELMTLYQDLLKQREE